MAFFLLVPLFMIISYAFFKKGTYGGIVYDWSFDNFIRVFDWLYLRIFYESFKLAAMTTFFCLIIGYPLAYVLATSSVRWRVVLLTLLVIPFWTNFVVRTYAIKALFAEQGPLNQFLIHWGWITEPLQLSNSLWMVWVGMVTNYLPYMVLPLYVAIDKFDFSLLEAGRDLGASSIKNFTKVLLPLTKSGMITGSILVFTPALGEFLIPDILGGAKTMLLGNLITDQFLKMRDWPFGSALSVLLLSVVSVSLIFVIRLWSEEQEEEERLSEKAA